MQAARLMPLYRRLPAGLRSVVASLRGMQLRARRYGRETEALAAAALERDHWDSGQWHRWQQQQLTALLDRAATKVPFYRNLWANRQSDRASLRDWPVLSKQSVRADSRAFVADDADRSRLSLENTSGTSGTPIQLWQNREDVRAWYALMEARWRMWNGVSRTDPWAILGGQLITPVHQTKPPYWIWNYGLNQLYLSSYHISAETCAGYLEAIRRRRAVYLWGYASSLYSLAVFARDKKLTPPPLKAIISNAEPLLQHQREMIAEVFGCPVKDTYGMSEMLCAASECEAGSMHLWPETGVHEVLEDETDEPVPLGRAGRLVCTGFLNQDMPLVRYDTGDRVIIAPPDQSCACGRRLPLLLSVEGRCDDVLWTTDDRRIGRMDTVFKSDLPIVEAQIIQETLSTVRVLVVPGNGYESSHEAGLQKSVKERLGEVEVIVEQVKEIPRTANGKFRAVISKIVR
ncbi:MAG TPA: hypothetical protein VHM91_12205 [Verrucomicrobiales bacterium]|nr:hypothetical protein [Verrucomicrobiales bacterium]